MGYFHFENEDKNDNAKMPAANKPSDERSKENWDYNQRLLDVGVTSPVQTSFQLKVVVLPSTKVMAKLSKDQFDRLSPEDQKLRSNVNPGRPNVVHDLESALSLGMSMEEVVNSTLEELVERKVKILAVNYSVGAIREVVGGGIGTFLELTTRAVGTKATIHRDCMVVIFSNDTDLLLGLEAEVDEDAESRLAELRVNATDEGLGNIFISISDGNRCLAKYSSLRTATTGTGISVQTLGDNVSANTLGKLGKKYGVTIKRLKDRSEYQALVTIENGTEEMKRIMARNKKTSPKTNPELKKEMEDHFDKYAAQAKGQKAFPFQTAFMNGIEAKYGYPVDSQKDILRKWWTKKTKDVKKKTGDIKAFFTTTRK